MKNGGFGKEGFMKREERKRDGVFNGFWGGVQC